MRRIICLICHSYVERPSRKDWFKFITRTIWSNEKILARTSREWKVFVRVFLSFSSSNLFPPFLPRVKSLRRPKKKKKTSSTWWNWLDVEKRSLLLCKQSVTNIWIHLFLSIPLDSSYGKLLFSGETFINYSRKIISFWRMKIYSQFYFLFFFSSPARRLRQKE